MKESLKTLALIFPEPSATRRIIEFDTSTKGKIGIDIPQNYWGWAQIQRLLDEVFPYSTSKRIPKALNADVQTLEQKLYQHLPDGKGESKVIIESAKRLIRFARRGTPATKAILRPYFLQLKALLSAARQKFAVNVCLPNQRQWDVRAYRLFLEFQNNLARLPRIHFITLTFKGNPSYKLIKAKLSKFKRKLKDKGFGAVPVVSFHPSPHVEGLMHAHLIVWTQQNRSASQDKVAVDKCRAYLKSPKSPFGHSKWTPVSNRKSFVKIAAYVAFNYDQTISQAKGPDSPIPKRSRVLSRPKRVECGGTWSRVANVPLVTPATTAWNKAVPRYAAALGRSLTGDRNWVWRERRHIREYLEPETWWDVYVTGLDG